jgi:hypothetical protein
VLIPIAGCGVFLGLSALTVTMLRLEGVSLPFVPVLRAALIAGAGLWSVALGWQVAGLYADTALRRSAATLALTLAALVGCASWALLFWPL